MDTMYWAFVPFRYEMSRKESDRLKSTKGLCYLCYCAYAMLISGSSTKIRFLKNRTWLKKKVIFGVVYNYCKKRRPHLEPKNKIVMSFTSFPNRTMSDYTQFSLGSKSPY